LENILFTLPGGWIFLLIFFSVSVTTRFLERDTAGEDRDHKSVVVFLWLCAQERWSELWPLELVYSPHQVIFFLFPYVKLDDSCSFFFAVLLLSMMMMK